MIIEKRKTDGSYSLVAHVSLRGVDQKNIATVNDVAGALVGATIAIGSTVVELDRNDLAALGYILKCPSSE